MRLLLSAAIFSISIPCLAQPSLASYVGPTSTEATQTFRFGVEGYAVAGTPDEALTFAFAPGEREAVQSSWVSYATNYGNDHSVLVSVDGDLNGLQLSILPVGAPVATRVAKQGSSGTARALVFASPGTATFMTGIRQAVARQNITYRLFAAGDVSPPTSAAIVVEYTIVP